ncbi:MAG: deoxyribose-phosphate aldolase [Oscillospiraceae bacterium]|nr:deoxyribose-phosphate aldolase [Oscillospiraceae bacterium]
MDNKDILRYVDHTLLSANATADDIWRVCGEAVRYGMASACIPPTYVKPAKERYPSLNVCTVIGFPLGYPPTEAKIAEAGRALEDGCDEIDMVINILWAVDGEFDKITDEIAAIKKLVGSKILKVIIETCYLTENMKIALCRCITEAGADFIKTSTGFGTAGAVLEDIELFKKHIGPGVKIKAAGGIRTKKDLEAFIAAGCSRIGTSGALKALVGETAEGY